jgi:ribose/xylose/arabinose/galactoside ABC-type transport system permease subunit
MENKKVSEASKKYFSLKSSNNNVSLIIAFLAMCILFSLLTPHFLTLENFINIGTYSSIIAIMAFGLTVAMILGAMDLSQYAIATASGMLIALLNRIETPIGVAIILAILMGVVLGAINGIIVSFFGVNAIITTLGTQQIFRGIAYIVSDGKNITLKNEFFSFLGRGYVLGIPIVMIFMAIIFAITFYVLKYTPFGRKVFAIGGNAYASYLSGINIKRVKMGAFIYSGITAALGGILLSAQIGVAMPTAGIGSEMDVIAAVILGGVSLAGGNGKVSSTLLGILILQTISNGLTLLSVQSYWQMIIKGFVLILAVLLDVMRTKRAKG